MMHKVLHKRAIALLVTVFFIMLVTLSVGVGLKYINIGSRNMQNEQFTLQSSIILNDVLKMLQSLEELKHIDSDSLAIFLTESSLIPFESNGVNILIQISSARAKINPNTLSTKPRKDAFRNYLMLKMVNTKYADMLFDIIDEIKEDMDYKTNVFTQKPYLFRGYIASYKHLKEVNDSYMKTYHDVNLKNIDVEKLFYVSKDKNSRLDLNYASSSAWELMLGCDESRAEMLSVNRGAYESLEEDVYPLLSVEEKSLLMVFNPSIYEPYIDVKIEITKKKSSANIRFEYDIISKKGSNFVFEV